MCPQPACRRQRRDAGVQRHPLRVKAGAVGLDADEYHAQDVVVSGWSGMTELDVDSHVIDTLFAEGVVDLDTARELPCHTGIRLLGNTSSALAR